MPASTFRWAGDELLPSLFRDALALGKVGGQVLHMDLDSDSGLNETHDSAGL